MSAHCPPLTTRPFMTVDVFTAEPYRGNPVAVVLDGQGRIELVGPNRAFAEGDHTLSALEPGDVVVIPAGYSRRITNIGDFDLVFLAICTPRFRPAALPDAPAPSAAPPKPGP